MSMATEMDSTDDAAEQLSVNSEEANAESFGGVCKRRQPWGKTFTVILPDGPYISCTHDTPHKYKL